MISGLPSHTSILVVGGGPAGLVSLKYALEYGPKWDDGEEPVLVEMESEIGGTFRYVALLASDRPAGAEIWGQVERVRECRVGQLEAIDMFLRLPVRLASFHSAFPDRPQLSTLRSRPSEPPKLRQIPPRLLLALQAEPAHPSPHPGHLALSHRRRSGERLPTSRGPSTRWPGIPGG